jgi:protein-disulfide isomerase
MRLIKTLHLASLAAVILVPVLALPVAATAQGAAGGPGDAFKDTSMLKLPEGQRAAIFEFEDLECPACSHAAPIVQAAVKRYNIAFLRHDFPLGQHIWSRDAAITARFLQDKVSPDLAEQYRLDVFAAQMSINSKDDLQNFTRNWFQKHGKPMPFALGPDSLFGLEVQADYRLGERMGVVHTPTIIVLGPHGWVQVVDVAQLYSVIDQALAQTAAGPAKGGPGPKKPIATGQH